MKALTLLAFSSAGLAVEPCRIEIVDKENGWPVPLVELRTTHDARYVSDNAGLIVLDDPDLFDRAVWFHVKGHGYGVKKDGFGYEGIRTSPAAGGTIRIEVDRRNISKRLGRLTGGGLFAEQQKLGVKAPEPETGVFGCDSVLLAKHEDKLFWLWGDTTLPGYPLGVFHSTAAHSSLQPVSEFKPPLSIRFSHFRDADEKVRGVAPIPGDGPTWLTGMASLPWKVGLPDRLVATYTKIKNHLDEYEVGLCVWDPEKNSFESHHVLWKEGDGEKGLIPRGHPFRWKDEHGKEWLLFGDPFPTMRCPATFEGWETKEQWEKVAAPPHPRAAEDGAEMKPHRGSVTWNPFRKRWVTVFTQTHGKPSAFGEIWYAEAASPMGPWGKAVKILTHDNYTFYNPRIHPELTPADASFIVFEGTYTAEFANHAQPTPRYNYNQILYRLDLDDPKLAPARE
ncbi:hypothetical protein OKA05_03820 [Luteolibacter arcticus]|uniref:DUF4185 domain-containing protein n=1 Tax=Luteolibacter arcticus TaxID=1581411 RepID=A0ABT3GDZ9_9BACT|nr:hypothetical protein [Luteolibacter arcticus]MCW1921666.1 hypothetical protein [Luteolibacter arcticus]